MGEWGNGGSKTGAPSKADDAPLPAQDASTRKLYLRDAANAERHGHRGTGDGYTLPADIAFLVEAGLDPGRLWEIARIAERKRLAASEVLIARAGICRERYLQLLAEHLGAGYHAGDPDPAQLEVPARHLAPEVPLLSIPPAVHMREGDERRLLAAPEGMATGRLIGALQSGSNAASRLTLISLPRLRLACFLSRKSQMAEQARSHLRARHPAFSAREPMLPWQKAAAGLTAAFVAASLALPFGGTGGLLILAGVLLYLPTVCLRARLIAHLDRIELDESDLVMAANRDSEDYPRYSVLVPLLREADQIEQLVRSLDALQWPVQKREIFLICEASDPETVAAVRAAALPDGFQLVICPDGEPKTKPKALNYALPLCTGDFTVIYDAEDRPHCEQLIEAWSAFKVADDRLACLQAPLSIHNHDQNWLTAMFALEYETLFNGLLPVLESLCGLMPLGGTSNHFRTRVLRHAGGWDAYNVTEDADLGLRLARLGYRCGTIRRPTLEEAPPSLPVWLGQRKRWLKGWFQTIMVHTRHPVRVARELGARRALAMHLLFTVNVLSILIHPLFLGMTVYQFYRIFSGQSYDPFPLLLLGLTTFNFVAGYSTYAGFAMAVRRRMQGEAVPRRHILSLPVYWLLISFAAWAALVEFARRPFHWEKTRHGLAKTSESANM